VGADRDGAGEHRDRRVGAAMKPFDTLITLALQFALLSLFAIGGAMAVIPEMHRQAVDVAHWMTERQFADLFAIAQAAPGPNIIIVTLIGYQAAGVAGALTATLAMCGPTCVITFYVSRIFDRFKDAKWRIVTQAGLVPVSVGLFAAGAFIIARAADQNLVALGITLVTAAVAYFTRINPLWLFAAAGLLGYLGVV
jgi:chromate transporter